MPDVDGIETLRRIRHKPETAGVPVVMYTAFDSDDYRRAASELARGGLLGEAADAGGRNGAAASRAGSKLM